MKKQFVKSLLSMALAVTMLAGDVSMSFAAEAGVEMTTADGFTEEIVNTEEETTEVTEVEMVSTETVGTEEVTTVVAETEAISTEAADIQNVVTEATEKVETEELPMAEAEVDAVGEEEEEGIVPVIEGLSVYGSYYDSYIKLEYTCIDYVSYVDVEMIDDVTGAVVCEKSSDIGWGYVYINYSDMEATPVAGRQYSFRVTPVYSNNFEDVSVDGETSTITWTAPNPKISNISWNESSSGNYCYISYSSSDTSKTSLTVTDAVTQQVVYQDSYYWSGDDVWYDEFSSDLVAGRTYVFTLTPKTDGGVVGTSSSVTMTAPVLTISSMTMDETYSSEYFSIEYSSSNARYGELTITDLSTGETVYSDSNYWSGDSILYSELSDGILTGKSYKITLTPKKSYIIGTPKTQNITFSQLPVIAGLQVKEVDESAYELTHSQKDNATCFVYYEYSTDKNFVKDVKKQSDSSLSFGSMEPGKIYYVRAYAKRANENGAYSNILALMAPVADITSISTDISSTTVGLKIYSAAGHANGYEISRKTGKGKYQVVTTTNDSFYKDTGLKKNTKYTYRVRAYVYNADTSTYTYGEYAYKTVKTGNLALNFKAKTTGKTSIKLTWNKLSGVTGYDIYRLVCSSNSHTYKENTSYNFTEYELVKSVKKKVTSYTDKKITAGEHYYYRIAAYKLVKGKKVYVTESTADAGSRFSCSSYMNILTQVLDAKTGTKKITWEMIPDAKGYLIEKYDEDKGYVAYKNITNVKTTSFTFPAAAWGKTDRYRIRAYKGNRYTDGTTIYVERKMAAVTGVQAQTTADGIKVSWNPVSGASYYRVYRSTSSEEYYDADTKSYRYYGYSRVPYRAYKVADATSNYYYTLGNGTTKLQRDYETERLMTFEKKYNYSDDDWDDWGYDDDWDEDYGSDDYRIKGTSVIDYNYTEHELVWNDTTKMYEDVTTEDGVAKNVKYYYYVVAYMEVKETKYDNNNQPYFSYSYVSSIGSSKAAGAAYGSVAAPSIKTVKGAKKKTTITINKVANAKKYIIYRATSKKGKYVQVGTTTKTTYTDSKLKSKKTYYYKVKAVTANKLGGDVISGYSAVKSAKTK